MTIDTFSDFLVTTALTKIKLVIAYVVFLYLVFQIRLRQIIKLLQSNIWDVNNLMLLILFLIILKGKYYKTGP